MELKREFVWGEKLDFYGNPEEGWRPFNAPDNFDFGPPHLVAHDLLEHLNQNDFSLEGEMQASGATLLTRFTGNYNKYQRDMELLAIIVSDMVGFLMRDPRPLQPPPTERVQPLPLWLETIVNDFVPNAARNERNSKRDTETYFNQYTEEQLMQRVVTAMDWMRVGYREAEELYRGIDPRTLDDTFVGIANAVQGVSMHNAAMPGDRLTISLKSDDSGDIHGDLEYRSDPQYTVDDRRRKWLERGVMQLILS